jgi:hypothetical protein
MRVVPAADYANDIAFLFYEDYGSAMNYADAGATPVTTRGQIEAYTTTIGLTSGAQATQCHVRAMRLPRE